MTEKTKNTQADIQSEKSNASESSGGAHSATRRKFATISDIEIRRLYTPADTKDINYDKDIGQPGEFPYTRGIHANMYRSRVWTMRQFAGMGNAEQTNERYHYLLLQKTGGLSVAFDLPTLMGYDSDHERSLGEVGKCGVAIDTLADFEVLFKGIELDKVSTSMTINSPASIMLAMYFALAEKQGVSADKLRGTLQNDILKEYIAQKEWIYPPRPSVRLITDLVAYCTEHAPLWHPISVSGYHIREAGSTAAQELAFTLADGFLYIEESIKAGLDVDKFAPRLSFFFNAHSDFFEEIAKYRAARRIYARKMRDKYGAKSEKSLTLRFHAQTAGCSLTAQQPENNIVRTSIQALSAALGGAQSLHTNSMDETLALPSDKAALIALRTQQVLAEETGIINTVDPLGGSYFVEALTNRIEAEALDYLDEIEKRGGVYECIESAYFQREIASASMRYQREVESGERKIVGVNDFVIEEAEPSIPVLQIDRSVEESQVKFLAEIKRERDNEKVSKALAELKICAQGDGNTMYPILDAVRVYASVGEVCDALREVWGEYTEPPF
ncbi:MAG: methylmalonyl-CoA mutase family protein [candidate division Zixibacteria bacterium]|nr:methylmalonyl-CoA mutase family protein [candidate division Zixibacteria bacterium]